MPRTSWTQPWLPATSRRWPQRSGQRTWCRRFREKGPFTVFAPTDEAFAKIPKADLDALLKDKAKLKAVFTHHVVPGKVMPKDLKAGKVMTVQGSDVTVSTMSGAMVNNAKVVSADVDADNGVIHAMDTVLMPK